MSGPLQSPGAPLVEAEAQPKWLVRAGDSDKQTWLCATVEDVRLALAVAMFGSVQDAEEHAEEWDGLMDWFNSADSWDAREGGEIFQLFEDGSLQIIALRPTMKPGQGES